MKTSTKLFYCLFLGLLTYFNANAECIDSVPITSQESTFIVFDNGTIIDQQTNLMWKQCGQGLTGSNCDGVSAQFTWSEALEEAELSQFAGYDNWRVPNIKELRSIVDYSCNDPSINESIFPNTKNWYYWSSTPYAKNSEDAWRISFSSGNDILFSRDRPYLVRLVRDR